MDRNLSGAANPGQSGPGSDGNEEVLRILQSSSISEASRSDGLVSYLGHFLEESYPSIERQSVYSAASADRDRDKWVHAFSDSICLQLNAIVQMEFERTYSNLEFLYFSHYSPLSP